MLNWSRLPKTITAAPHIMPILNPIAQKIMNFPSQRPPATAATTTTTIILVVVVVLVSSPPTPIGPNCMQAHRLAAAIRLLIRASRNLMHHLLHHESRTSLLPAVIACIVLSFGISHHVSTIDNSRTCWRHKVRSPQWVPSILVSHHQTRLHHRFHPIHHSRLAPTSDYQSMSIAKHQLTQQWSQVEGVTAAILSVGVLQPYRCWTPPIVHKHIVLILFVAELVPTRTDPDRRSAGLPLLADTRPDPQTKVINSFSYFNWPIVFRNEPSLSVHSCHCIVYLIILIIIIII